MSQTSLRARACAVFLFSLFLGACGVTQERSETSDRQQGALVFPPPPDPPRFYYERTIFGSADVVERNDQSEFRTLLTGERETSDILSKPYAVAVHHGRIFATDTVGRGVKVFDIPEARYFVISDTPEGLLGKPLGIDVDGAGRVYVADGTLKKIMVFDRAGKFVRSIGSEKEFDRLSSVTVNDDGTRVYAVDIGGVQSQNHRVRVFDGTNGEHLFDIGKRGGGPGEFNLPRDLAVGKDGRLYVVDGGNFRVQVFDKDGKFIKSFGKVGRQLGDFARPKEIASDKAGNVYIADAAFGNFQVFDPDGNLLMFVGQRSETNGPGRYMLPSGIFVDEDGRIYMVDQWFKKIDIFRPAQLKAEEGYLVRRRATAGGEAAAAKVKE